MRRRRFAWFLSIVNTYQTPVRVLDVGGTAAFWQQMGFTPTPDIQVTLLNVDENVVRHPDFEAIIGDARDMTRVDDAEFDVVFSNSVIEHVGGFDDQYRMAREIRRVGCAYFVQTPNFYFPIEPHFLFPCFQFLPLRTRAWLVSHSPWAGSQESMTMQRHVLRWARFVS